MSRHDRSSPIPSMSMVAMSSDGEESSGNDKMLEERPAAKRLRNFSSPPTDDERLIDNIHRYDLPTTFSNLVGRKPYRQLFTVHHDLVILRSRFFRAARFKSWSEPSKVG